MNKLLNNILNGPYGHSYKQDITTLKDRLTIAYKEWLEKTYYDFRTKHCSYVDFINFTTETI